MSRYLLKLSYDGTAYHGWQIQPNGITVQQVICDSLKKMLGDDIPVTGCSRTDAGVHAREFCCHIDTKLDLPKNAFLKGLNSVLPDDIKVTDCKAVSDDFHARYSCKGKRYSYCFYLGKPDPFVERYALRLEKKPDLTLMNKFCKTIIGKHDFYAFSASKRTVTDTVRTVTECFVVDKGDKINLKIAADGFLYNMVRIIAGTALAVGEGRLPCDCAIKMFESKDRALGGETLPAKALILEEVFY